MKYAGVSVDAHIRRKVLMPVFYYKVGKEDGSIIENEVEAESADALRAELDDSGYLVLELRGRKAFSFDTALPGLTRKLGSGDFLVFNQELLVLIKAGLPIVQSLDLLTERTTIEGFKRALLDVKKEVLGGRALSEAMAMHTEFFPELYCNSLRSGEKTGEIAGVLSRYIAYLKRVMEVKQKLKSALTYPVFLIGVTFMVIAVLFTYVVPTFSDIYADFNAELPRATVILMTFTKFLKRYLLFFIGGGIAGVFLFRFWYRTEKGRTLVDRYVLKVPLVGTLINNYYTSTISRTLATVLSGGIPMLDALDMVARSVTNRDLSTRLRKVQSRVREGMSLYLALEESGMMSQMTIRMVEVGEATGSLETMLDDISTFYEDEVNANLQRVTTLIEPVIMLLMGAVVGTVVLVMYLPIFELAGTVR